MEKKQINELIMPYKTNYKAEDKCILAIVALPFASGHLACKMR